MTADRNLNMEQIQVTVIVTFGLFEGTPHFFLYVKLPFSHGTLAKFV